MQVEIWSDVVCPWCYVGKRRFERGLAEFAHRDQVEVTWRSFQLDGSAPHSDEVPGTAAEQLAAKTGRTVAEAQQLHDQMAAMAAGDGLEFHFERMRAGNTWDAHRLLHLAKEHGIQDPLKEALDHATFTEGLSVSDHDELTAVAVAVGLAEDDVREVLGSDRFAADVRADLRQAQLFGITGVPHFVLDRRYAVPGAQSPETVLRALEQAWADRPLQVIGDGDACEGDACVV
jgi:predicted DsbA family dithiol-disulfide isomerase